MLQSTLTPIVPESLRQSIRFLISAYYGVTVVYGTFQDRLARQLEEQGKIKVVAYWPRGYEVRLA